MAHTRRRRLYGGILLALLIALMAAGFRTAEARDAGSFADGISHVFDYPAEVLTEASQRAAGLPGHLLRFFPALAETLNIAAASTPDQRDCRHAAGASVGPRAGALAAADPAVPPPDGHCPRGA